MGGVQTAIRWVGEIAELVLALLALAIVASVLIGPENLEAFGEVVVGILPDAVQLLGWTYLLIAILVALIATVRLIQLGLLNEPDSSLRRRRNVGAWITMARSTLGSLLTAYADALVWPVYWFSHAWSTRQGKRLTTRTSVLAREAVHLLSDSLVPEAICVLVVVAFLFLLQLFYPSKLVTVFLMFCVGFVTLTQLGWMLSSNTLARHFRYCPDRRPLFSFLVLGLAHAAILLLAFAVYPHPTAGASIDIVETMKDLFLVQRALFVWDLFDPPTIPSATKSLWQFLVSASIPNLYNYLVTTAGLVFYLAIIKAILQPWRDFSRTDDDRLALAQLHLNAGQVEAAEKWSELAPAGDLRSDMIHVGVDLTRGEVDRAYDRLQNLWNLYRERPPTRHQLYRNLVGLSHHYELPADRFESLIDRWAQEPVSDLDLFFLIEGRVLNPNLIRRVLKKWGRQLPLSKSMWLLNGGKRKRADVFLQCLAKQSGVPGALARLLRLQVAIPPEEYETLAHLKSFVGGHRLPPGSPLQIDPADLEKRYSEWAQQNLVQVKEAIYSSQDDSEQAALREAVRRALTIGRPLRSSYVDELAELFEHLSQVDKYREPIPLHSPTALIGLESWTR